MKKNIQESFVAKTSKKRTTDIIPKKLELDEQSFFSLIHEYTDSLGIKNFNKGDIVDTKSESGHEKPIIVQKEVKRYFKPESASVGSFIVSLVVSPYSYFLGRATEIPVFDLKFKVLFYPNENNVRIGIYVNDFKADCCRKKRVSYEVFIPRHFFRKSDGRFLDKGFDFFYQPKKFLELTKMGIDTDTLEICKNYIKHIADFKIETEKDADVLDLSNESLEDVVTKVQSIFGTELFHLEENVFESFTKKISSKKNTDLIPDIEYPDGVYILHETLGVKTVEEWNPKDNDGVVGILLIEDDHKIVVALEDSPIELHWSEEYKLVNQPIKNVKDSESDFNGEKYCRNLNSPDFPAAYYCLNYNKGGRSWYLPSSGELWLIRNHLKEIQNALSIVGGQKFVTTRDDGTPKYWSSTEETASGAWYLHLGDDSLYYWPSKVILISKVRPISKFQPSELKESFTKKTRNTNSAKIVQDADDKAFNPLIDAKEFINRLEECILSYKQPYVYGKKNPYNLEKFSFEMITSWPNTFKFNRQIYHSSELLFDVSNSKKPSFRIKLIFFELTRNIICYLTVTPAKPNKEGIYEDRLFQYIYDSKKKRISFVENPEGVRFNDNIASLEPSLRNLNFILNDIRFLMDNWKILYKTYLKKDDFETWDEFYKMLPSQNNKGFDFDLKESFTHKISKKTTASLKGGEMFGEMESFGEFDMLFKRFLKKHEHQFSSCLTTDYPFKSMTGKIGYKVVLKKDCPFEDGSNDTTTLRFVLDVFQGGIMNFPGEDDLNTPHGILTPTFFIELGPHTPQQIYLGNLEFVGESESLEDFRFDKFEERREWKKPNYSYRLLFGFEKFLSALVQTVNNMDKQTWSEIGKTSANFEPFKGEACCGEDSKIILDILDKHGFYSELHKNFSRVNLSDLNESFTKKISSKKNTDLISEPAFVPGDGVYILHETLGMRTVEGWNPEDNDGVVGILLIEDDHKIVVALEDSPKNLLWSDEYEVVNHPIQDREDAESDFNGDEYCRNLNSPDFPAAYYCLNYKKGGRNWYLPSSGELWLIYRHLEEVQNALSIVGGQKFVTTWDGDLPCYWSSTDKSAKNAWDLGFHIGVLTCGLDKVAHRHKVRPVSNFRKKNTLKESFTKKISSKKNSDLVPNIECPDGVYILHETLGVRGVDGWKPKDNDGVIGILLIEDDHKIVVALEDSPKRLRWSDEYKLVNHPIKRDEKDAESDFNGEEYCRNLNSPDFPAAYYCLNYNKDGRSWYLPSTGELWMIHRHFEEVQTALSIVGGQKFVTKWKGGDVPRYWSSTEERDWLAWILNLNKGTLDDGYNKYFGEYNVRPVSKFKPSELRESFTKKIKNKSSKDLTDNQSFQLENGLYIFHETLGIQDAETWDSKYNKGVVGVLLIHNEHKFVVSVDVSPELCWSKKTGNFTPKQYRDRGNALGDYDSESNCSRLNSPEFPAAHYCHTYKKGGRKWRLGSLGEMSLLMVRYRRDFDRILEKVGAVNLKERAKTNFNNWYWTSTEYSKSKAWTFYLDNRILAFGAVERYKTEDTFSVIPISTFEYDNLGESFTHRVSRKRSSDLVSDIDYPDGVYILHETLGVRTVNEWNPEDNDGVVGILVIKDNHKIVVALEDAPENLHWSKNYGLFNQSVEDIEDAESDFNGEQHCLKFNSLIFPAAYYCLHYKKGGREWYLPSSGELWMIYRYLDEIQTALSVVGGQKLITTWDDGTPLYWSSTENSATNAWLLYLYDGYLKGCGTKVGGIAKVRPVSIFTKNENLKESFTKKTTTKGRNEIIGQSDNLVVDYENIIKGLIKKYGFSTIHKYGLSLSRDVGYKGLPYVRRHEPFTEDKMVTILGELEFDKSEMSDNDIKVTWRRAKKFHYRSPIEKTEKFSELSVDEKRDIYEYLINWLNVRIDEDEKIEKMDKLPQSSRNVV